MGARSGACALALLSLLLGPLTLPTAAQERPLVVIVVDFQRVVRESAAAAAVRAQIDGLRDAYQEQFGRIEEELRAIEAELTEERPVLRDEEFLQRRRAFEQQVIEAQRQAQYRRAALDRALDEAMDRIQSALLDVIAGIAERQRANIVLSRSNIVMVDQALDFTAEALAELNAEMPYVDVVVPDQQ